MTDSATRWNRLKTLFDELRDLDPDARNPRLAGIRSDEPDLAEELVLLLDEHDADEPLALEGLVEDADRSRGAAGQRVGAYRLVEPLGQGGMGQVFLAERVDGQFEHRVALKLMRGALDGPDTRTRFLAERQILARLEHPNIARLLDGGVTDDGAPYIVMEWVRGRAITRYSDEEGLDLEARLDLFIQVCRAVQAAHRRLVIHRDLKPSNILVTDNGAVKLLDFGIAKLLETDGVEAAKLTRTGVYVLTPEYASPEQVSGEDVGTTSDVYALGLLLYELLTGVKGQPVASTSPMAVVRAVCLEQPKPPSQAVSEGDPTQIERRAALRGGLSSSKLARCLQGDLDTIVGMAVRKEPDRRYLSAEDLGDDILRYLTSRPVRARRDSISYRVGKFVGRHRVAVSAAAVAVLALVGGLTASLTLLLQARQAESRAVVEAEASRELADFLVGLFNSTDPTADPGAEVTAQSLLDRGAAEVQERLENRPTLRADLLLAIGRAYYQLGLGDAASPLLTEAARLREEQGDYAGSGDALVYVAFNHIRRGARSEGVAAARRGVTLLELAGKDDPESLARAYSLLGQTLYGARMHDQAAPALEKAIALQEALDEPDAEQLSVDLDNLGNALMALGDTERGLGHLERSVEVLEADGGDPGAMANSLNRLGLCQIDAGRIADAEASLIRARSYAERAAGGGRHPEVADAEAAWATYWGKQGDLERMAACLRRATEETEAVWGPKHYKTAMVYLRLGNALTELGEPAEALERLQQGRSILAATAAGHVAHLQAFDLPIAQALADLGRTGEAIEVLRPLLDSANPRRAEAAHQLLTRLEG